MKMKKYTKTILLSFLLLLFYSCTNDENTVIHASEYCQDDQCGPDLRVCCGLSGYTKVKPLKKYTYTISTGLRNLDITWKSLDGSNNTSEIDSFNLNLLTGLEFSIFNNK